MFYPHFLERVVCSGLYIGIIIRIFKFIEDIFSILLYLTDQLESQKTVSIDMYNAMSVPDSRCLATVLWCFLNDG